MTVTPGVDLLTHFYKLDHFINISNICCIALKRSSLQERESKFTPKKSFMRSTKSDINFNRLPGILGSMLLRTLRL